MSTNTLEVRPYVELVNGTLKTNSFKIAEHFGKIHRDVVRAIDSLDCSDEFRVRNFAQSSVQVPMPRGGFRKIPAYEMTRDGFSFLVMGFTGKEASRWKEAYINAFNAMESQLSTHGCQLPLLPTGTPGQRFLVRLEPNGSYSAMPVPDDALVMTFQQFLKALNEPNGMPVDTEALVDFAMKTIQRLGRRCAYYQNRATRVPQ